MTAAEGLVEQMRVVDEDRDRLALAARDDCAGDPPHDLHPPATGGQIGDERGVGTERQRRGGLRRADLQPNVSGGGGEREALSGEPGLADAGRTGDQNAAPALAQQPADALELAGPPDERPAQVHLGPGPSRRRVGTPAHRRI